MRMTGKKSFSLTELMVASALVIIFTSVTFGIFTLVRKEISLNITSGNLQCDADVVIGRIIKGSPEPGGIARLSEAISYQLASVSELHFVGTDRIERWYRLSPDGKSIVYHHPTASGIRDEVIYTAPAYANLTLRFWIPAGAIYTNIDVGIDVGLSQKIYDMTVSGSATTMVNIRNHFA